jgi:hypothetical protein
MCTKCECRLVRLRLNELRTIGTRGSIAAHAQIETFLGYARRSDIEGSRNCDRVVAGAKQDVESLRPS